MNASVVLKTLKRDSGSCLENFLGLVEGHVEERVAVDLDDLVADGQAAVAVDPAAGLDALDDESTVVVAGDDVDTEGAWKVREVQ